MSKPDRDKEIIVLRGVLEHMLMTKQILTDRAGPSARRVFVCLGAFPELSVGEIAKCIGESDSIASRAVSVLIDMGLARVAIDPCSRRRHLVQLTPVGVMKAHELARHALEQHARLRKLLG